jgi:hypothetical protein
MPGTASQDLDDWQPVIPVFRDRHPHNPMPSWEMAIAVPDALTRVVVAIHEAGHAVAAVQLGLELRSVRIDSDGEGTTYVAAAGERWREDLVMTYAGDAAVRRAGGLDCSAQDDRDAWRVISRLGWSALDVAIELGEAKHRAERLVSDHWPAIERVAAALLRHRHLLPSDVRRLMAPGATGDNETQFLMRLAIAARRAEVPT